MDVRTAGTLQDMVVCIERAGEFIGDGHRDAFLANPQLMWAVWAQLLILGEASTRIPKDFQQRHPELPWSAMIGNRHRMIHGYDVLSWETVWKTATEDLPAILPSLRALVAEYTDTARK